jgi:subfamily B ATP-binding cassette protein MsbA
MWGRAGERPHLPHPQRGVVKADVPLIDRQRLSPWALGLRFAREWLWPARGRILATLLLTFALAAATSSYPFIIKLSFDTLLTGASAEGLFIVLAAIIGATTLRSVFLYLQTVASNRIALRLTTDIQKRAFAHLIGADYARITREATGQLVSRLTNDLGYIQQATLAAINTATRDVLIIIGLVIAMISLDWVMSLIVLGVYPFAVLPIAVISERLRMVAKRTHSELGDMTSLLTETLGGARLIKTFRLEPYATGRVNEAFDEVEALRLKAVKARARLDPMLEALGGVAIAGVIALAYWRISTGISTVGDFMGFITALFAAAQPIRGLGNLSGRINEGLSAVERINELLDEPATITDKPGAADLVVREGVLAFERASFAYPGRAEAVRDVTVTIPSGGTVALVGRSGAGKTTLINLVPRLFDVTGGRITIDGADIRDVTLASLRNAVAIVSQDVTLFDDTIRANIALGRLEATDDEIAAAARAAAADEFIRAQPDGYLTPIGDRGARLSGGQRQRVALARAILKDAPILLLDEATSALDAENERLVQAALATFTKNRTTLVVAHRLSTVRQADLICVMDEGRIVESGTHADLITRSGLYADLCRGQLVDG